MNLCGSRSTSRYGTVGRWLLLLLCLPSAVGAVEAVDDERRTIRLDAPAQRIISLAPHATELLFAAGAGRQVVAVTAWSDYPPAARDLPRVGDAMRLDRERIVSLAPDLVVAWGSGNPRHELNALRARGIPVFVSEPHRLHDIARQLEVLGRLTGNASAGRRAAQTFSAEISALGARYSGKRPLQVFYQLGARPLFTINGDHLISSVMTLCGGRNVFAGLKPLAGSVSLESVVTAAPDVIVYGVYPGQDRSTVVDEWQSWRTIPAVARSQIYGVPAELVQRSGPRIVEGARQMCLALDEARAGLRR